MSTPLFRPEAVQAQTAQWLGGIHIAKNPHFTLLAMAALTLAVAMVVFSIWGQTTRRSRVAGVLMPTQGLLHITAPQNSRVTNLLVKEGDEVRVGQPLVNLYTGQSTTRGDTAALVARSQADRLVSLESERRLVQLQHQQRHSALADRMQSLQREILQAEGELNASTLRLQLSTSMVERYRKLADERFISEAQLQAKQEELLERQLQERSAQRSMEGLRRELEALKSEIGSLNLSVETQHAQMDRAKAILTQESTENSARAQQVLTAPVAGTVGALLSARGQSMQAGQSILSVIPQDVKHQSILQAELYAPSGTTGFVQPGQPVWLRLAAFPYQKFGMIQGIVRSVSRTPINPQDLPVGQAQILLSTLHSHQALYRITVALEQQYINVYGKNQHLKVGMTLDADVIQDRRAVWEWVLEPLMSARTKMQILGNDPKPSNPGG